MSKHLEHTRTERWGGSSSPDLAQMIWRRKGCLIGCLLISLALGAAYLTRIEPSYRVQARVLVQQQGLPLDKDHRSTDSKQFLATQAEIIRSPAVVQRAVDTLKLTLEGDPPVDPTTWILEKLIVMPVPQTNVLSISFTCADAERATRIVQAVIVSYREYLLGSDHDTHFEAFHMLTQNEKDLRQELRTHEQEYRQLRKYSPLMGQGKDAIDVQRSLLTHLGERLTEVKNRRIELENRVRALSGASGPVLVALISQHPLVGDAPGGSSWREVSAVAPPATEQPIEAALGEDVAGPADFRGLIRIGAKAGDWGIADTRLIEQELYRAEAKQKGLAQDYGPKHPQIRRVREEIAAWQARLQERIDAAPRIMRQELLAVRLHEKQLGELYQDEFTKAKAVDAYLIQEQQSLDGIRRLQSLHDSVLTQLTELQMADQALSQGRSAVKVGTLEAAVVPERLLFPPPSLLMAVCAVVGLIGGFGLATILERTDSRRIPPEYVAGYVDGSKPGPDQQETSEDDGNSLPLSANLDS